MRFTSGEVINARTSMWPAGSEQELAPVPTPNSSSGETLTSCPEKQMGKKARPPCDSPELCVSVPSLVSLDKIRSFEQF